MEEVQFDIEEYTELFELFGQELFCPVCQEHAEQGDRILEINECHHMFHEPCLEPWLREKGTCPLCRVSIFGEDHRRVVYRAQLYLLLHIVDQQILNERRLLTWILCDGILQRFPSAGEFLIARERCNEIIQRFTLRTIRPLPIEFINRTRLLRFAGQIRHQLLETHQERTTRIRIWVDVVMMRRYIEDHSLINPEFQTIWQ